MMNKGRSLTSRVISVPFNSEHETDDKFCSEAFFRLKVLLHASDLRHMLIKLRQESRNIPPKSPTRYNTNAIKTYCRICPTLNDDDEKYLEVGSLTVVLTHPESNICNRNGFNKRTVCTFDQVFGEEVTNKDLSDQIAVPLVKELISGINSVLFAYGTPGKEKMHTMRGIPNNSGIVPRCLDVIFNSISNQQAKKFIFKPDHLNGFEVQPEAEAERDRNQELDSLLKASQNGNRENNETEQPKRSPDSTRVAGINKDNMCAVFVSLVQIHNNRILDVLDEGAEEKNRANQIKILRQDGKQNMYIHGVTEVEVKSSAEALELYLRQGRKSKSVSNFDSRYCQTVFTLRLVQAVKGCEVTVQQGKVAISQLSIVDVPATEQTDRTNNVGHQLKQTGQINNNLLSLRTCLEVFREKQTQGTSKVVPYRTCKLTHLFKNYFDGNGLIRLLVCISPLSSRFDETLQAMSFAITIKEMLMTVPAVVRADNKAANGNHRSADTNEAEEPEEAIKSPRTETASSVQTSSEYTCSSFPDLEVKSPSEGLQELITFLQKRSECSEVQRNHFSRKEPELRDSIERLEQNHVLLTREHESLVAQLEAERERGKKLAKRLLEKRSMRNDLQKQLKNKEDEIKESRRQASVLGKRSEEVAVERDRMARNFRLMFKATEQKSRMELNKKLEQQRLQHEALQRNTKKKLQRLGKILSPQFLTPSSSTNTQQDNHWIIGMPLNSPYASEENLLNKLEPPGIISDSDTVSRGPSEKSEQLQVLKSPKSAYKPASVQDLILAFQQDVKNTRMKHQHRRSQSAKEGVWLTHHSGMVPENIGTVLQPHFKRSKRVDKLPTAEEVSGQKIANYCLLTQEPDSSGGLETRIYKADVVPTVCGGAQVVFNEMETLQQKSPSATPLTSLSAPLAGSSLPCSPNINGLQTNAIA